MAVALRRCVGCGDSFPLMEFRDVDSNDARRRTDLCVDCQLQDDTRNYPPGSPWCRAEREVERLYGIPSERWMNDPRSPLGALFLALMARAVMRHSPRKRDRLADPLGYAKGAVIHVEQAMGLCERRGLRRIAEYDDGAFFNQGLEAQQAA